MKLFEIEKDVPIERIEEALISACVPFKLGKITGLCEDTRSAIWDVVGRKKNQRCMAYLVGKKEERNKYIIHIWGNQVEQEGIMSAFLNHLNISEKDIKYH